MAAEQGRTRRYIIMSTEGFHGAVLLDDQFRPSSHYVMVAARAASAIPEPQMRVLDTIHDNGPKLVEMQAEGELSLRLSVPGLKIVPEVFYERQWQRFQVERRPAPPAGPVTAGAGMAVTTRARKSAKKGAKKTAKRTAAKGITAALPQCEIVVTDQVDGKPVRGAHVVAFTDFAARVGVEASSGASGIARLKGLDRTQRLERVYVNPPGGYWGVMATDTTGAATSAVSLARIDLTDPTLLLRRLYDDLPADAGTGVTIGIIDTGVDAGHPALTNVVGGLNCVGDEVRADPAAAANWRPALKKGEHGTHVAGIAAGKGLPHFRGVAPGATLRSYRVFPDNGGLASSFDIAKAIDAATTDGCHIINLSLGGGPRDDLTRMAVARALTAGVVVVAAAGNDGRKPVSFPAAMPDCVAVSAMGRVGTFPKTATGMGDVAKPTGGVGNEDFVAAFSNVGTEIDVTGAGVEIVSTLPGGHYGSMSGTSMAAPAVAGFAAHLLAATPGLLQTHGEARSRALKDALYSSCKPAGFGRDFEGFGLPLP